jgi:hypothetical protein
MGGLGLGEGGTEKWVIMVTRSWSGFSHARWQVRVAHEAN